MAESRLEVPKGPKELSGVRAVTAPMVDGELNDGEWPSDSRGDGFFDQGTGLASDEKGEFWLTYDSKFVYFAGRVETDPRKVVDDEYRPNVSLSGNDYFALAIDAPGGGQDVDLFEINPQGATSLRLAGGRAAKTEWLGEFEAKGKKTAKGWQFEARIPWTLVTLPAAGKRDLVFNVLWFRSNRSNTYEWVWTKDDFKNFPRWTGVDVPAQNRAREVKALPYMYAGASDGQRPIINGGVDLKSEVSDDLTVVGTVNPDFRNIENSILSLDHSYFERLVDEARPFFQEGGRYRKFGFDQRVFASQRIGDFDAGLNAYGKVGANNQFGAITTFDFGNRVAFAGSLSHRFDNSRTLDLGYVRNEEPGQRNDAFNMFYDQRVGDVDYFLTAQATDDAVMKTGHRLDFGAFRENGGVDFSLEAIEVSPEFYPRLGFSPEQDMRGLSLFYGREIQRPTGRLQSLEYSVHADSYWHFDGSEYRRSVRSEVGAHFRDDFAVGASASVSRFEGSDDYLVEIGASRPISNPYRGFDGGIGVGRFNGIPYKSLNLNARYRPVKRAQLNLRTQWVDYDGFDRQIILSANYDVGKYEAVGGRLVRQGDDWNWYLSYRMSGKRGNEVFLILGDPNTQTFAKQLILKVVIPVSFRL